MISHICTKLHHLPSTFIHISSYIFYWPAREVALTGIIISILEMTQDWRDKVAHSYTQLYLFPERKQHVNPGLLAPILFSVLWLTLMGGSYLSPNNFCSEQRMPSGPITERVRLTALLTTWDTSGPGAMVKDGPPCH